MGTVLVCGIRNKGWNINEGSNKRIIDLINRGSGWIWKGSGEDDGLGGVGKSLNIWMKLNR